MSKPIARPAPESKLKIRGFSYIRMSTPQQIHGDSFARQSEQLRHFCERYNIELDDSLDLRDIGVSAFRGKNATQGKLGLFIRACKDGRVPKGSWLICEHFDRFSRLSFDEALPLVNSILQYGVSIAFRDQIVHPNASQFEKLQMAFMFYLAHEESDRKSKGLKGSWKRRRAKAVKERISGVGPFWLDRRSEGEGDKRRMWWVPNPERVAAVKLIFKLSLEGNSQTKIAILLNADKVPTFQNRKGHSPVWTQPMVQTVLTSRAVIGEYQPHIVDEEGQWKPEGEPIPNHYPRVISDEVFFRVQAELARRDCSKRIANRPKDAAPKERKHYPFPTRANQVTNIFRTLIRYRGNPMRVRDKSRRWPNGKIHKFKYLIERRFDGQLGGCINYERVEQAFLKHMREIKAADLLGDTCTAHDVLVAAESKLSICEQKLADMEAELLNTDSTGDAKVLGRMMVKLEAQRKQLSAEADAARRESNVAPAQRSLADTHEIIELLDKAPDEATRYQLRSKLRMLVSELVSEIICFLYGKGADKSAILGVNFRGGGYRVITVGNPPESALRAAGLTKGQSTRALRPRKAR